MADLKRYLLEPINEIFEAARLLDEAADAHLAGRNGEGERLIRMADNGKIFEWSEMLWSKQQPRDWYGHDPNMPGKIKSALRDKRSIPTVIKQKVLERDGYICRFCGIPVVDKDARDVLKDHYPEALPFSGSNTEKHKAFQAMELNFDHLLPRARGGKNTVENLVVACAPCNCAREDRTLADMELEDPRSRPIEKSPSNVPANWEGLSRVTRAIQVRFRAPPELD